MVTGLSGGGEGSGQFRASPRRRYVTIVPKSLVGVVVHFVLDAFFVLGWDTDVNPDGKAGRTQLYVRRVKGFEINDQQASSKAAEKISILAEEANKAE